MDGGDETACLDAAIRKAKTWQFYVPMSCQDVNLLVRPPSVTGFVKNSQPFFFGNHPLKWICIAGKVTASSDQNTQVLIEVSDGSGDTLSVIARGPMVFSLSGSKPSVVRGSFVIVNGYLKENQWGRTIMAQRMWCYNSASLQTELSCYYEALKIRQVILEKRCEYDCPVPSSSYPNNMTTLYVAEFGSLGNVKEKPDFLIP